MLGVGKCDVKQHTKAALPPRPQASPDNPFQMIGADFCKIKAKTWLVYLVWQKTLHLMTGHNEINTFLTRWGVERRISSDYNPNSNLRSETGVKTAKRPLMTSTKSNWDKVSQALLQHMNTPIRDLNLSPAQLLFGRAIRDLPPVCTLLQRRG